MGVDQRPATWKFLAEVARQEEDALQIALIISSENHKPENFTSEELQQWNSAANTRGQYNAELIADRDRNLKELDGQGQYNAELIADLGRNLKELGPIVQEQFTAHQMKHCMEIMKMEPMPPGIVCFWIRRLRSMGGLPPNFLG